MEPQFENPTHEQTFRKTFELAAVGIAHVGAGGKFLDANPHLCEMLGYPREELLKLTVKQVSHPDDANVTDEIRAKLRAGAIKSFKMEKRYLHKDGSPIWVAITIAVERDTDGSPLHDIAVFEDICARKHAEKVLRESEERFRALANLSSDWYWELDTGFRFIRVEGRYVEGGEAAVGEEILGKTRWETGLKIEDEGGWPAHRKVLEAQRSFRDVVMYRTYADSATRYFFASGEPLLDQNGGFAGYRGVGRDITERKKAEARIQYLATHDGLTDLPNRVMFNELLRLAVETAKRYERQFAVFFIDLDRFKFVNDTLGHEAGDVLLREMSSRFKDCLRASDVVARLGGDEFVVLVQEVNDIAQVSAVARKILSAAIKPVEILGQECRVTASVGIALYPGDATEDQSLMKHADMAMYLAKEEGKNNFQFYSKDIKTQSLERMTLETQLRHALDRNEFTLHYQAKVDFKTGRINGVEALLRWQNAELGSVSPIRFIPVAEETGLIIPIGRWVLRTACAQNVAWQRQGLPPICVAVNLSMRQFADPDLLTDITAALKDTGMAPERLELELTESMVMQNIERTVKLLTAIKNMGVRLAIDDFGTGYSSLAQIKRFPLDTLKVDRSFIRELQHHSEDQAITEAIIAMGKTLSLTVVAEGVETPEQEQFLRAHACDEMQGYYFSKPVAPEDFASLLREHVPVARP
ncbi:MAG TPA: EAL domain-containing protein [Burkholderiales bacterium]